MFTSTGDLVIFAIKAGLKLGHQAKTAYAEATIKRELVLPLPDFNPEAKIGTADGYFSGSGQVHLNEVARLKELYEKSMRGEKLTPAEEEQYVDYYLDFKREDDIKAGVIRGDELGFTSEALLSLVKVRQWALKKSPFPSVYQRILGTAIEIGIEYFSANHEFIDTESAKGRALLGFLNSIDDLDFASEEIDLLARRLFIAAIEAIGENPDLLGGDHVTEHFVETVSRGLVSDINAYLAKLGETDLSKKERVYDVAQLVLRSILNNLSSEIIENPGLYLSIHKPQEQALVTSVGKAIVDLLVRSDSFDLDYLFGRKTIDKLVKAALKVLSEYPSLAGIDNEGLKKIISEIASELSATSQEIGIDLLPDIVRLLLEKTAINARLVWPDGFNDPAKHLLITVAKEVLEELANAMDGGSGWTLELTKNQILDILEATLEEVAKNPQWLVDIAGGESSLAGLAIREAVNAFKSVPPNRITPTMAKAVILEVVEAVARRKDFLDKVSLNGKTSTLLGLALDAVVSAILSDEVDRKARWVLGREEMFEVIVEIFLDQLEQGGISSKNIRLLKAAIDREIKKISSGEVWSIGEFMEGLMYAINGGINGN